MAFYELRQYRIFPGKMDEWLKIMEEEIIPFQVALGMVITGSGVTCSGSGERASPGLFLLAALAILRRRRGTERRS